MTRFLEEGRAKWCYNFYMWQRVVSLTNTKTWKEALGFFIFHVAVIFIALTVCAIILLALIVMGALPIHEGEGSILGKGFGALIWLLYSLFLNGAILIKKKLYKNILFVILAIISSFCYIVGIVVAAFLTTRSIDLVGDSGVVGTTM